MPGMAEENTAAEASAETSADTSEEESPEATASEQESESESAPEPEPEVQETEVQAEENTEAAETSDTSSESSSENADASSASEEDTDYAGESSAESNEASAAASTESSEESTESTEESAESTEETAAEGSTEGAAEGVTEGAAEEAAEGTTEGTLEGASEGTLEASTEGITEGAAEGVTESTEEGLTESEETDARKDGEEEKYSVSFSGLDPISAEDGQTIDLLSGVSAVIEKEDGTKEDAEVFVKSVHDSDGNDVSVTENSITVSAGMTYTVTYGIEGKEDTAERTIEAAAEEETDEQEEEFKADVKFKGCDDLDVDAESDVNLLDGVTAVYKDKEGNEKEASVSIEKVTDADGNEVSTGKKEKDTFRDDTTLYRVQTEMTYTVVYKNDVTDQTAERTVHVGEKTYDISFSGTKEASIAADRDFDLMEGVSASYEDRDGTHDAEVVIKKVTDKDGNEISDHEDEGNSFAVYRDGNTLKNPESEAEYIVTYGTELSDQTVERTIRIQNADYHVEYSGIEKAELEDGKDFDLKEGVTAEYKDLAGRTRKVKVSVESVKKEDEDLPEKASEDSAYREGGTIVNPQSEETYTVTYANDVTDETVTRTLHVKTAYVDSLEAEYNGMKITLSVRKNSMIIPKGSILKVEDDSGTMLFKRKIKKSILEDEKHIDDIQLCRLSVEDKDGNEIETGKNTKITFETAEEESAETSVYSIDGRKYTLLDGDTEGNAVTVSTEDYSRLAVVSLSDLEYVKELKTECDGMEIIVSSKSDVIPEGCTLKAEACDEDKTQIYSEAVKSDLQSEEDDGTDAGTDRKESKDIKSFALYSISILDEDGDKFVPEGEDELEITFKDAAEDVKDDEQMDVYQFRDGDTEKMEKLDTEVDEENDDVTCRTTDF